MIRAFLSRYRPRYKRSLVYMLQSSEYNVGEYLKWYRRTADFTRVERRKQLVWTPKARLLWASAWLLDLWAWIFVVTQLFLALWPSGPESIWLWGYPATLAEPAASWVLLLLTATAIWLIPRFVAYGLALPLWLGRVLIQRPREKAMIKRAKRKLAEHPAAKIAIAGSFGKTSFKYMLATVLAEGKRVAAAPGNMNTPIGISRFVDKLTGNEEVLIFELGEYYPGDIRKLSDLVQPDVGIITGINEAHLLRFKTLERTVGTIFELADWLSAVKGQRSPTEQTQDKPIRQAQGGHVKGLVYVNGESELARLRAGAEHLLYTRKGVGKWQIKQAQTDLAGTRFVAQKDRVSITAASGLLGLHQIGPLAACIDLANRLDLSKQQIEAGIAKTKPFEHRLEPRPAADGVVTIDDSYNGNPTGVQMVIEFLGGLKGHRRWYVTPGLKEMGPSSDRVHRNIGQQLAAAGIEKVVLVKNSVTPRIAEGLEEGGFDGELIWFDDALKCFAALPNLTVSGDVVLLQNDWADQYA
ncbi:UDP-N-acetylmuramoyl-tripeptide--D-alanyl-D-alanine ligase [Candidatus Parcubacteria bacterium]|nr:UDP-N-acetylmuramoyl-tripeptide--D-alanyl-D-alanine ligase [Candidatus Parcubacteria bacterium]